MAEAELRRGGGCPSTVREEPATHVTLPTLKLVCD